MNNGYLRTLAAIAIGHRGIMKAELAKAVAPLLIWGLAGCIPAADDVQGETSNGDGGMSPVVATDGGNGEGGADVVYGNAAAGFERRKCGEHFPPCPEDQTCTGQIRGWCR